MLGKRFQRTPSMSQLGPATNHARLPPHFCRVDASPTGLLAADCRSGGNDDIATMGLEFDPSHFSLRHIDTILTDAAPCKELCFDGAASSLQVLQARSPLVSYQMGLWTRNQEMGFLPQLGLGKLQQMSAEASTMDFLHACFHCKRRLTQERDIFMYRGDSAFCSAECRQQQILIDERRSRRGSKSKRGGGRSSSETAVAA